MEQLTLEGKDRIVNIYRANEIPKYLQTRKCRAYAYRQKFTNTIVDGRIQDGELNAVGAFPSDLEKLRSRNICLLTLKKEGMLKRRKTPITFYEVETFLGTGNDIHVGQNHRPMDDGNYTLEDGTKFTVKGGLLVTNFP